LREKTLLPAIAAWRTGGAPLARYLGQYRQLALCDARAVALTHHRLRPRKPSACSIFKRLLMTAVAVLFLETPFDFFSFSLTINRRHRNARVQT
jgi:hypothetical protein